MKQKLLQLGFFKFCYLETTYDTLRYLLSFTEEFGKIRENKQI